MDWILEVYIGRNLTKKYKLDIQEIKIGRAKENHLNLPAEVVSRYHATLSVARDYVVLEDLKSTNGTYYKNKKIDRVYLKEGDFFIIGPYGFKLIKSFFEDAPPISSALDKIETENIQTGIIDKEVKDRIIVQMQSLEDTQVTPGENEKI